MISVTCLSLGNICYHMNSGAASQHTYIAYKCKRRTLAPFIFKNMFKNIKNTFIKLFDLEPSGNNFQEWLDYHKRKGNHIYITCKQCRKLDWWWKSCYNTDKERHSICRNCLDKKIFEERTREETERKKLEANCKNHQYQLVYFDKESSEELWRCPNCGLEKLF